MSLLSHFRDEETETDNVFKVTLILNEGAEFKISFSHANIQVLLTMLCSLPRWKLFVPQKFL